jgi:hypothetical protein
VSKLTKFLLQHGSLIVECETNSNYYEVCDKKVRVSDHLPGSRDLNDLIIFIPENSKKQYIVALLGKLYIHASFTSLRQFLETWIVIAKGFYKDTEYQRKRHQSMQSSLGLAEAKIEKYKRMISAGLENPMLLNIHYFTKNQQKAIEGFIALNKQNSEIGLSPK